MSKHSYLTQEGLDQLKEEIRHLESVERPKISAQIAEARDKGDLSENAEYDAAKDAQGMLEMKIAQLKETLRNAKVLDKSKLNTGVVQLMNTVKLKNKKTGTVIEYTIVPEREASVKEKKISAETPIAKGLFGKKKGESAEIEIPSGTVTFEILDISLKR